MTKKIRLYYVTDPICSYCWAIEPVLRRFRAEYGGYFDFQMVMGGLLEKWADGPIDPANGIYQPADVVSHWREVGKMARMPIDASLMATDPVQSSYPPSRVFKIIQRSQGNKTAERFIRRAREGLFVFNKNISNNSVLIEIVNGLNLNGEVLVSEAETDVGQLLLEEDFSLAKSLRVRAFPTVIMIDQTDQGVSIVGARPLENYVDGLKRLLGTTKLEPQQIPPLASLFEQERLLFAKEIEVMYDLEPRSARAYVAQDLRASSYQVNEFFGEFYFVTAGSPPHTV